MHTESMDGVRDRMEGLGATFVHEQREHGVHWLTFQDARGERAVRRHAPRGARRTGVSQAVAPRAWSQSLVSPSGMRAADALEVREVRAAPLGRGDRRVGRLTGRLGAEHQCERSSDHDWNAWRSEAGIRAAGTTSAGSGWT